MRLERQQFGEVRETDQEKWEKVDLLSARVQSVNAGEWVVERAESDEAHHVQLAEFAGEPWGTCSCKGYQHHAGPCSHLCAIWRAWLKDMIEVPPARVNAVEAEVTGRQQQLADHFAEPEVAADGGAFHVE